MRADRLATLWQTASAACCNVFLCSGACTCMPSHDNRLTELFYVLLLAVTGSVAWCPVHEPKDSSDRIYHHHVELHVGGWLLCAQHPILD